MSKDEVIQRLEDALEPSKRLTADAVAFSRKYGMEPFLTRVPRIVCADGFSMSVQASDGHYCQPRDSKGPWYQVEVGFPSEKVDALMPFIEGDENQDPTSTVYGYVPIETVVQVIIDHGGFTQ